MKAESIDQIVKEVVNEIINKKMLTLKMAAVSL